MYKSKFLIITSMTLAIFILSPSVSVAKSEENNPTKAIGSKLSSDSSQQETISSPRRTRSTTNSGIRRFISVDETAESIDEEPSTEETSTPETIYRRKTKISPIESHIKPHTKQVDLNESMKYLADPRCNLINEYMPHQGLLHPAKIFSEDEHSDVPIDTNVRFLLCKYLVDYLEGNSDKAFKDIIAFQTTLNYLDTESIMKIDQWLKKDDDGKIEYLGFASLLKHVIKTVRISAAEDVKKNCDIFNALLNPSLLNMDIIICRGLSETYNVFKENAGVGKMCMLQDQQGSDHLFSGIAAYNINTGEMEMANMVCEEECIAEVPDIEKEGQSAKRKDKQKCEMKCKSIWESFWDRYTNPILQGTCCSLSELMEKQFFCLNGLKLGGCLDAEAFKKGSIPEEMARMQELGRLGAGKGTDPFDAMGEGRIFESTPFGGDNDVTDNYLNPFGVPGYEIPGTMCRVGGRSGGRGIPGRFGFMSKCALGLRSPSVKDQALEGFNCIAKFRAKEWSDMIRPGPAHGGGLMDPSCMLGGEGGSEEAGKSKDKEKDKPISKKRQKEIRDGTKPVDENNSNVKNYRKKAKKDLQGDRRLNAAADGYRRSQGKPPTTAAEQAAAAGRAAGVEMRECRQAGCTGSSGGRSLPTGEGGSMNVFDKGKSNDGRLVWHEGAHAYLTALGVPQSYQKNHSAHLAVDRFARIQARRKYRPSEEDSNIGYCSAQARRAAAYTNCMKDAAGNPFAVQGTVVDPSEEQATSTCSDVQSFSNLMMGACQAQVSYCPGDGMDNCCSSSSGFGRAVADPSGGQGTPHPWAVDPTEEDSGTGIPIIDFGGRTPPPGVPGGGPTPPDDEDDPTPGDPSSD